MNDKIAELNLVSNKSRKLLNQRQTESYREHRRELLGWMLEQGKNPGRNAGLALSTVESRAYRLDLFYRMVWEAEGRYTEEITTDHADAWMRWLDDQDYSDSYKAVCQKSVKTLFRWKHWKTGGRESWTPEIQFNSNVEHNPRDILTQDERRKVREAALSFGSIPSYDSISVAERKKWRKELSHRYGIPLDDVGPWDWVRTDCWEIPSLIWTTMDCGLRPKEVATAKVSWVDLDNGVLRIPKEDSVKNEDNWQVSLLDRTTRFLEKWLDERELYEKYDDSDLLWLNQLGHPFTSTILNRLLRKLLVEAEIDTSSRHLTWYSIRHSVGTYMTREAGLKAASAQLRHKSAKTTMRYDQAPVEDRRDALERMG